MKPFDLAGRVAVVTGANTGIGQGIALADAGADLALVGRPVVEDTARRIEDLGRRATIVDADLSTIAPVQSVADRTLQAPGGLDILANNGGVIRRANSIDVTETDSDAMMDTNRQIMKRIPAAHWGDPSDIGAAAVFLASDAARYVHGHVLPVDGGWLAR